MIQIRQAGTHIAWFATFLTFWEGKNIGEKRGSEGILLGKSMCSKHIVELIWNGKHGKRGGLCSPN